MNAGTGQGSGVGPTLYVGPGAGGMPTASAVVVDLVEVACGSERAEALPAELTHRRRVCPRYLKIAAIDQAGVFAEVADTLGRHDISIEEVIQRSQRRSARTPNPGCLS